MTPEEKHVSEVIDKMRNLCSQADTLMEMHAGKTTFNRQEKDELQQGFRSLKEEIIRHAKTGTIDGKSRALTDVEEFFFAPAVTTAKANILVSVNADPAKPEWFPCIYGIKIDIGHLLSQLDEQLPD